MAPPSPHRAEELSAVLDVGKTHVKLIVLDAAGTVLAERRRANASVRAPQGYLALDTDGITDWLHEALAGLGPLRPRLRRLIATTHGAAIAALSGDALALPVPDYEFDGFEPEREGWTAALDGFEATLSPPLPRGLNAATQLDWLARHCPREFAAAPTLLPYPQYWAWWLGGVAATELSSLGCHTHLWRPRERRYTELAERAGWAVRFAPVRPAWQALGPIRAALAHHLGLDPALQVHCGVHDSNACLARYLRHWPRFTLVSSGTWVVVMAVGAAAVSLQGTQDLLGNVSVSGEVVPTGRFMGGRELLALCAGADPSLADAPALARVLERGVMALPGFESQGGPFFDRPGRIVEGDCGIDLMSPPPPERAALAMLYCAEVTAWLIERLGAATPVVIEGPFAASTVYTEALAALLPAGGVCVSSDPLEGTARGAWLLTRWIPIAGDAELADPPVRRVEPGALADGVRRHQARWRQHIEAAVTPTY